MRCSSQRPFNHFLTQTKQQFKFYLPFCSLDASLWLHFQCVHVFSTDKEELHPFKGMLSQSTYAIYQQSGPAFGDGWDIYIADNANSNNESYTQPKNYKLPEAAQDPTTILAGTRNFSPDDWEVFYLE